MNPKSLNPQNAILLFLPVKIQLFVERILLQSFFPAAKL